MYVAALSPHLHCHTKSATPVLTAAAFPELARDRSSNNRSHYSDHHSGKKCGGTPHIKPWWVLRHYMPAASSKPPLKRVLYFSSEEWERGEGGGVEARRGRSHSNATVTHTVVAEAVVKEVAARRGVRNGLSAVLVSTPGMGRSWRRGGGNSATNHGSNNCGGAVSPLHTSVERHGTGKHR